MSFTWIRCVVAVVRPESKRTARVASSAAAADFNRVRKSARAYERTLDGRYGTVGSSPPWRSSPSQCLPDSCGARGDFMHDSHRREYQIRSKRRRARVSGTATGAGEGGEPENFPASINLTTIGEAAHSIGQQQTARISKLKAHWAARSARTARGREKVEQVPGLTFG